MKDEQNKDADHGQLFALLQLTAEDLRYVRAQAEQAVAGMMLALRNVPAVYAAIDQQVAMIGRAIINARVQQAEMCALAFANLDGMHNQMMRAARETFQAIGRAIAEMPEDERAALIKACEDAPLEGVDVNATTHLM
jgi:hypothetical protein